MKRVLWLAISVSVFLLGITSAGAVPYEVRDLGTLGVAKSINNSGQVVGESKISGSLSHAFLWLPQPGYGLPAGVNDLGTLPGGNESGARDINDSGQVVGWSYDSAGDRRVFFWQNGASTSVKTLGGSENYAYGINELGCIVGWSKLSTGHDHAFIWENHVVTALGKLPGDAASAARDVNDSRQVVGYSVDSGGYARAVIWNTTGSITIEDLGTLPGGRASFAYDINSSAQVVGYSDDGSRYQAVLWSTAGGTSIWRIPPAPAWVSSEALGINDKGQVVGSYWTSTGACHAFLWAAGDGVVNLPPLAGDTESVAWAINESGQIVGASWLSGTADEHAVLWTPIPEPSGFLALLCGLGGLGGVVWRRRRG